MPVQILPQPPRAATCVLRFDPPTPLVGQVVRIIATFTFGGLPFDPSKVGYKVRSPAGRPSGGAAVKVAAGVYELLASPAIPGLWTWRVEGAGGEGVAERELLVRASSF